MGPLSVTAESPEPYFITAVSAESVCRGEPAKFTSDTLQDRSDQRCRFWFGRTCPCLPVLCEHSVHLGRRLGADMEPYSAKTKPTTFGPFDATHVETNTLA